MMFGRLLGLCILLAACAWPGAAVRAEAPVRMIEVFSFSCSHCARFHRETFPWLKRAYIDSGKVDFTTLDFPLNLAALKAAQAAHCGGGDSRQALADLLWRHWDDWIEESDVVPPLTRLLVGAGIDPDRARRCLADGNEIEQRILTGMKAAIDACAIDRTPTFFVNNERLAGLPDRLRLEAVIEEQLRSPEGGGRDSCLNRGN